VLAAAEAGLPVSIFRPGLVSWSLENGRFIVHNSYCPYQRLIESTKRGNERDWLNRLMRGLLAVGIAPKTRAKFGLIPVDYVAAAIVKIGQMANNLNGDGELQKETGKIYHLSHSTVVRLQDILLELHKISRMGPLQLKPEVKHRIRRLVESGCGRREDSTGELTMVDTSLELTQARWWSEVEKMIQSLLSPGVESDNSSKEEQEALKRVIPSLSLFADGIPSDVEPESISCANTTSAMHNQAAPDAGTSVALRVWLQHLLTSNSVSPIRTRPAPAKPVEREATKRQVKYQEEVLPTKPTSGKEKDD